jgi:hypothetical protein
LHSWNLEETSLAYLSTAQSGGTTFAILPLASLLNVDQITGDNAMMDSFSRQDLQRLVASQGGPHLSIYLPAPEHPTEAQQDSIRLANLLRATRKILVEYWMPESEANAFLSPIEDMCRDARFLADRGTGMAIFRVADRLQSYKVDPPIEEKVVLGRTFHVRAILSQVFETSSHILALSKNRVALLSTSGDSITELEVPGLPPSLALETSDVTVDRGAQIHSSGRGTAGKQAAVFHGQGGHPATAKTELREYMRRVDEAVRTYLRDVTGPIILAGVDEVTSMYRDVSDSPQLCESSISGNVDRASDDVLLEKAAVVMAEERDHQREAIAKRLSEPRRHGVATDPEQVLCAAFDGRVDTLLFDRSAGLYGSFDPDTKTMKEFRHQPTGDPADPSHDLIEMAVAQTLLHRGRAYPVKTDEMPVDAKMAVALRY